MEKGERLAILKDVFDCSADLAGNIDDDMQYRHYGFGDTILHQGDEAQSCSLVIGGRANALVVGIDGQYVQLASYEPGEIFGPYPQPENQLADIIADNDLQILTINSNALAAYAKNHADIGSGLANIFARRAGMMFDSMSARALLSAQGRVYKEILRRADNDMRLAPAPVVSALAVSVQTTRETASRAISKLVKRGILIRHSDYWEISAPRLLEDMIA